MSIAKKIFIAFLVIPFVALVAFAVISAFTQLVDFLWSRFDISYKEGFLALFQVWFTVSFVIGAAWFYYFSTTVNRGDRS